MTTASASASALPAISPNPSNGAVNLRSLNHLHVTFSTHRQRRLFPVRVANDSKTTEVSPDLITEKSEADKIVDGMEFGELCNEFECISSPSVEATARQLARDILELREGNRALGTYAASVKYKDPVRSFTGREKYKRPLWSTDALDKPTADMSMLSTSVLNIKWTLKGNPKNPLVSVGGPVILKVNSRFTLNQISGQVTEHEEVWDLSSSSTIAQAYFWASRRLYSTIESSKDFSDSLKNFSSRFSPKKENMEIYPDPSGDPTKFFQNQDDFQRDAYQLALFLALLYFLVQFLRTTL
ncbi:ABC transporter G family member 12 like protein [Tanacetum coccineum]